MAEDRTALAARLDVAAEQVGDDRLLGAARLERDAIERSAWAWGMRTKSALSNGSKP